MSAIPVVSMCGGVDMLNLSQAVSSAMSVLYDEDCSQIESDVLDGQQQLNTSIPVASGMDVGTEINVSQANSKEDAVKKLVGLKARKRLVNSACWKRNERKKARQSGKQYTN